MILFKSEDITIIAIDAMPSAENVWDDIEDHDSIQVNQQKDRRGMTVTVNDAKCLQLKHLLPILTKHLFPSQVMARGEAYRVMWHHRSMSVFFKRVWIITRNSLWSSEWLWLTDWFLSLLRGLWRWLCWGFWWGRYPRGRRWSGWYRRHSKFSIWRQPQDGHWIFAPTNDWEKDQSETPLHHSHVMISVYMFFALSRAPSTTNEQHRTAMQAHTW